MYTRCPNCATAFRVNARILKQASGKVRCGGCGTAFDALFFLSETRPASEQTKSAAAAPTVAADERAELLRTLDKLAGPEVRLKDTGVEWQLLLDDGEEFAGDEDSDIFLALDTPVDAELSADAGAARIDEFLDDAPAEVDEFLTATPSQVDATEVFSESADAGEAIDNDSLVDADVRFDDDTGVPGHSDEEAMAQADYEAAAKPDDDVDEDSGDDEKDDENGDPVDIAFGDPKEWGELLDESVFDETVARESADVEDVPAADEEDIPELAVTAAAMGDQSIDQLIDEDLMDVASEDEDGFTSTIAPAAEPFLGEETWGVHKTSPGIETIIMEGDTVRTVLDQEAAESPPESTRDADESGLFELAKQSFRGQLAALEEPGRRRSVFGIAGIAVLTVLLAGQWLHQSRAELATIPEFRKVIGPLYRTLGAPITPNWDVHGWRFEVTRGSTGQADSSSEPADGQGTSESAAAGADGGVLTIYSRVGNRTARPLPYPVINVALTDRFEAIIGSRAVEPADYLPATIDADALIPAGGTFNAEISIASPAEEATGFKLNVCYRRADGVLHCAIEDFR